MQEERREERTGIRQKSAVHAAGVGRLDGSMMNRDLYCDIEEGGKKLLDIPMMRKFATKIGRCTGC